MRRTTVVCGALVAWLAWGASAGAQDEKPEPPERLDPSEPAEPGTEAECFPPCRQGYVCKAGQCVAAQPSQPPPPLGRQAEQPPPTGQPEQPPAPARPQQPRSGDSQPAQPGQAPAASGDVQVNEGGQWVTEPSGRPPGVRSPRFAVGFHVGGIGKAKADDPTFSGSDFNPTYGLHARFDFPAGDYLALGPAVFFGAWQTETQEAMGAGRSFLVDIDIMLRGRLPVPVGEEHFDLYVGVPVGFSTFIFEDIGTIDLGDRTELGWNAGLLAGAQMFFSRVGVMAELGWRRHNMSTLEPDIYWDEVVFDVGLVLRFGS